MHQDIFVRNFPNVAFLIQQTISLHISQLMYNAGMEKQRFITLAGSQRELAKLLGISQAAVSQWKVIPVARVWQLKVLRPNWFDVID